MLRLDYKNYINNNNFDIEKEYLNKLYKSKFSKPSENLKDRFRRFKKENQLFKKLFFGITIEQILLAKDAELNNLVNKIEAKFKKLKKEHQSSINYNIKKVFDYKVKYQSSSITPFFTENFDFRICFYCNKEFITNFDSDKKVSTFQLDHFYDKATYPYIALSFYNLIPSCATCNSKKVKGSKNCFEVCKAPNNKDFDFDKKVKFKLFLDANCKNLHINSKDAIDIKLKENYSNEYEKYIDVFKLNERYKAHKDIVYEMLTKAEQYPDSRLKELQNLTGIPYQQIKKDIFGLVDEDVDLSKKPFSKLIKDMSKELGLT